MVTFVAEDDVWLASLSTAVDGGARAWRLTADRTVLTNPRLNPAGTQVAWTSSRDAAMEAYCVPIDGGPVQRLTYWGDDSTTVRDWLSDTELLVTSATGQRRTRKHRGFVIPVPGAVGDSAGGGAGAVAPAVGAPRELPYGPLSE